MFDFDATLPLMAIQFLLLVAVMNVVFYKPIAKAIEDRDEYIRQNRLEAQERLSKAENLAKQYEKELAETRKQAQAVVVAAQDEAQKIVAQKVAEAQEEARIQREQAQRELDQQKGEALQTLEQQIDALSNQIMDKLLSV